MRSGRRRPSGPAAAVALAVVMAASACSSASTSQTGSSSSLSTSPTTTTASPQSASPNPTEQAKAAALKSYSAFWLAQVSSEAHPKHRPDPGLVKHAIDKALADAQATIFLYRQNGIEMRGEPTHSAEVTSVVLTDPQTVAITDCLDSTHWRPVYAATGKSALAPGQSPRVIVESTATVYNGRWVIRTSVAHRDRSC